MNKSLLLVLFVYQINSQNFNNDNINDQNNSQSFQFNNENSFSDLIDLNNKNTVVNENSPQFQNYLSNHNTLNIASLQPVFGFDFLPYEACCYKCSAHYWNCKSVSPNNNCPKKLFSCYQCIMSSRWGCKRQC